MIMAAFGNSSEAELKALFSQVAWYQKPSFRISWPASQKREAGFAVDRDNMFQGITLVSVPVLSPSSEPLLVLTAAGHSHDRHADALGPLAARCNPRRRDSRKACDCCGSDDADPLGSGKPRWKHRRPSTVTETETTLISTRRHRRRRFRPLPAL